MKSNIVFTVLLVFLIASQWYHAQERQKSVANILTKYNEILILVNTLYRDKGSVLRKHVEFKKEQESFNRDVRSALESDKFQFLVDWAGLEMENKKASGQ